MHLVWNLSLDGIVIDHFYSVTAGQFFSSGTGKSRENPAVIEYKWSITIPSSDKFKTKCMYEV